MTRLIECVPNFSEGRRPDVIAAIRDAIAAIDRTAILDGIFTGNRGDITEQVKKAGDAAGRARAEKVLRAYDFVYDAREESTQTAA